MKSVTSESEDRVKVASESSTRLRPERLLNFVQEETGGPSSTTGSSFSSSSCSTANEWCIWQCHREVKAHWLENQFYSRVRAALPTAHCKLFVRFCLVLCEFLKFFTNTFDILAKTIMLNLSLFWVSRPVFTYFWSKLSFSSKRLRFLTPIMQQNRF